MKAGAELNTANNYGNTALIQATYNGHVDCVKELVKLNWMLQIVMVTALILAGCRGHVDCLKELVKAGAELNAANNNGNTALIEATYTDHVDCVKELVKARTGLNAANNAGQHSFDKCCLPWSCRLCQGTSESWGSIKCCKQ